MKVPLLPIGNSNTCTPIPHIFSLLKILFQSYYFNLNDFFFIKVIIRAWNIYESSPFSRKKFLSLCSIVKTTEWNGLIKNDN